MADDTDDAFKSDANDDSADSTFNSKDETEGGDGGIDSFVTSSSTSWWERIKNALFGILVGAVLIPLSVVGLSWNEGRSLQSTQSIQEAAAQTVVVSPDSINPVNEQKLIHLAGEIGVKDSLTDPRFQVSAPALTLRRKVEIYQWTEHTSEKSKKKLGGGTENVTETTYNKVWTDCSVESSKFKMPKGHSNKGSLIAPKWEATSNAAGLGAFRIPQAVISKINVAEPLVVNEADLAKLPSDLLPKARVGSDGFYFGKDPTAPEVGDQRVTFQVVPPGLFTILARQRGETLEAFQTKAGDSILRVEKGSVGPDLMFKHAQSENTLTTWLIRLGGFLAMSLGIFLILRPLQVFADVIPFLGDVLEVGIGMIAGMVGLLGSVVTIAVVWFVVRPVSSVALVGAGIGVALLIRKLRKW